MIVNSRVTTLSQPFELIKVCVAVLLDEVYVFPSIHVKLSQEVTKFVTGRGVVPTHDEESPFKVRASNSTSPLENWNLTALLKFTLGTVILFEQIVNGIGLPKKLLPLAVVLYTLTLAPPVGRFVTFIVYV